MRKAVLTLALAVTAAFAILASDTFPRHFMVMRTSSGTHKILTNDITDVKFEFITAANPENPGDSDEGDTPVMSFEFVDLGLKSGTLWATTNFGASKPEESGIFFSWGENTEKDNYSEDLYTADLGSMPDDISATKFDPAFKLSNQTAAMPNITQIKELVNSCTWNWETVSGVTGFRVTGENGNSIFIPASGFYREDTRMNDQFDCCYWSSTKYGEDRAYSLSASYMEFIGNDFLYPVEPVYEGRLLRPIKYEGLPIAEPDYSMVITAGGMEISIYNTDIESCSIETEYPSCVTDDAQAIDLGLPSGILWADRNIGADNPSDSGYYLSWGEVEPREIYTENSYLYYNPENKRYDNLGYSIAGTAYDAATSNWGDHWVMPTIEDVTELIENTSHEIIENGMAVKLTGTNGNSIVIPIAGLSSNGSVEFAGQFGYYHTATSNQIDQWAAPSLVIDMMGPVTFTGSKWVGQNVRPVWK